ncbi:MAG TPA: hypothetical protein VHQ42_00520 [Candidatus Limnocylindria bacterium]|nr:hypothetical protein [Candidatus Limnocylindria bacterium]
MLRWLMGVPPEERLDEQRSLAAERDRHRTDAIEAADRANIAGGSRRGGGPQDFGGF